MTEQIFDSPSYRLEFVYTIPDFQSRDSGAEECPPILIPMQYSYSSRMHPTLNMKLMAQ